MQKEKRSHGHGLQCVDCRGEGEKRGLNGNGKNTLKRIKKKRSMNPDFYTQINDHLSVMAKSNIIRHIKAKSYYSIHRFRSIMKVFLQSGKDRVHQTEESGRRNTAYFFFVLLICSRTPSYLLSAFFI